MDLPAPARLALAHLDAGRFGDAELVLRGALAVDPELAEGRSASLSWRALGRVLLSAGRAADAFDAFRRAVDFDPADADAYTSMLLAAQYAWPGEPAAQLELHRGFHERFAAGVVPLSQRPVTSATGRRLRVGYVSPDFRDHSVGHFIATLLGEHDRARFETHCFSNRPAADDDAWTSRIRASVDGWHAIGGLGDDDAALLIRGLAIDVLIDLAGHTAGNRLLVFARRPAPLQLTYLGYPNTTGLAAIDGRITDAVADPHDADPPADAFHVERLLRLDRTFAPFEPIIGAPPVAPPPCERAGHVTFGCVALPAKLNDAVLATWCDALRAAPTARLILVGAAYVDAGVRRRIATHFQTCNVDFGRLAFAGKMPFVDYLNLHARIDLMLDPFPFNGHTTTVQNLWMGVPVLTLAGQSHRGRMGASVLTSVGLPELIATTRDDYAARAAAFANDPVPLAALRQTLRQRMLDAPLMDRTGFARAFEALLLRSCETSVDSLRAGV